MNTRGLNAFKKDMVGLLASMEKTTELFLDEGADYDFDSHKNQLLASFRDLEGLINETTEED